MVNCLRIQSYSDDFSGYSPGISQILRKIESDCQEKKVAMQGGDGNKEGKTDGGGEEVQ